MPEPTLDEDTGNEEMGPLSCVITGTQTGECVFVYACVCVSVFKTDRRTDRRSPCCMHDLSHSSPATLCKQQFSGPEQEVSSSLYEQDKKEEFN